MAVRKQAFFLDAGYTIREGKAYISLILKGRGRAVKLYYQYDPYFLVDAPPERMEGFLALSARRKDGSTASPLRAEMVERRSGLLKKRLIKLYCRQPGDVPLLKDAVPFQCYEYGILFARRFMLDMQLSPFSVVSYEREGRVVKKILSIRQADRAPELGTMAFDIETYNPAGAPREGRDPVLMISYCSGKRKGVLTLKESGRGFVETLKDEKAMLERFNAIVKEENPDVLYGYNSANFDLPYLAARARNTGARFELSRFGGGMRPVKKGLITGMEIGGRTHFDLYPTARFFGFTGIIKAQDFTLNAVAEEVLGRKKVDIQKDGIWEMWDRNDIDRLCEYSLVDSELTFAIGERFLPLEMEMASVAKQPLFQTTLSTAGQLVESLLMFHAAEKGELIPPKPGGDAIAERLDAPIEGAFVKLPEPGIYENVAVLDFRGLYPSIIVSYNIDPGTLLGKGHSEKDAMVSPTGAAFTRKQAGLIPYVLDYLIDKRTEIKKTLRGLDKSGEAYVRMNARSQALKILANSFYGYMGYARSRYYSRPCAESVTAWGRKHINETIEKAEKAGFTVLYADTDSVFLLYKSRQDVLDFMSSINAALPSKMELELEGFYTRGVFVSKKGGAERGAKKKYALLGEDGRIKIRGFELVRRDWSEIAKETQLRVLEAVLREGSKEKAVAIIRETITRLREGKVPLDMLAISTQLNKAPGSYEVASPELSAAKKMREAGILVERGSLIYYVVGKKGKSISDKAVPLQLAKDYDVDYYVNNQVLPAVMKIMKELGYDEHSMKFGGEQKSLGHFFG